MLCDNCGTDEEVTNTELGILCGTCYNILLLQHLEIVEDDLN